MPFGSAFLLRLMETTHVAEASPPGVQKVVFEDQQTVNSLISLIVAGVAGVDVSLISGPANS